MAAGEATGRFFYGDLELWREAIAPDEEDTRGVLQEFLGGDRPKKLRVPASENMSIDVICRCVGSPNPNAKTQAGWIAQRRKMRNDLHARARYSYPVVWVLDHTAKNVLTVGAYPLLQTVANHGLAIGDVVLGRPAAGGIGTHYLASVLTVPALNQVTIATTDGAEVATAGDELHLVEAYWTSQIYHSLRMKAAPKGYPYASEMTYAFKDGGGSNYARTPA